MKMSLADVITHQRKHGFIEAEKVLTLPLLVESLDRIDFFMEMQIPHGTGQQKGERIVIPKGWPHDKSKKPFVHHFVKPEIEAAEKEFARHLSPFKPRQPFTGPLRIVTEWTWPWRESEPKKNRVDGWKWKDVAPDVDNLQKIIFDQMSAIGFMENDSQICDARATKQWGDRPGIRITLEALTPQAPATKPQAALKDEREQSPFE